MRRWIKRIGITAATIAVLYLVIVGIGGGVALALALTPGIADWSQSHQPMPKDPLEINYRGAISYPPPGTFRASGCRSRRR